MKLARLAAACLVAATLFAAAPAALAQAASNGKVVSANVQRIFTDSQERKDLEAKFKSRFADAQKAAEASQDKLKELQGKRNLFKVGSADYERSSQELNRAAVEAQVSAAVAQQEIIRDQKRSTRAMVEKIQETVKSLSEEKGYSIVMMQVIPPELSEDAYERMTPEQLNNLLLSRNILYVANDSDITAEVVARLDAAYKSGK